MRRMFLFWVALASGVPGLVDARCLPQALVAGDQDVVELIRHELDNGGLVRTRGEPDPDCFALRVRVQRRGSSLLLIAAEASGAPMEREASSAAIAATVIEAWALRGSEGEDAETIKYGPTFYSLRPMLGTARSTDDQQFYLVSVAATLGGSLGFQYAAELYYARGPASFFESNPALDEFGFLFCGAYDFAIGAFTISPELALGAGIGSMASSPYNSYTQAGLRERLALRFAYAMSEKARVETVFYGHLMSDPERVASDSSFARVIGVERGILIVGLSLGLRYSL